MTYPHVIPQTPRRLIVEALQTRAQLIHGDRALAEAQRLQGFEPQNPQGILDYFRDDGWNPDPNEILSLRQLITGQTPSPGEKTLGIDSLVEGIWQSSRTSLSESDPIPEDRLASHETEIRVDNLEEEYAPKLVDDPTRQWFQHLLGSSIGIFLLLNRGLNWQFTDVFFDEPLKARLAADPALGKADRLIYFQAPTALATQSRFQVFQKIIREKIKSGDTILSVPCGRMREIKEAVEARIAEKNLHSVRVVGVDLDNQALAGASLFMDSLRQNPSVRSIQFYRRNAIFLGANSAFDLISSNGLSIYLEKEDRLRLFKSFYTALKPFGTLVTSHLNTRERWDTSRMNAQNGALQALVFGGIIGTKWNMVEDSVIMEELRSVGFRSVDVVFNENDARLFPTFVATR